jgi:type IV pilus assembly protein PilV
MKTRPSPRPRASRRQMAGVSMIELLVAFLIFSLGMLGLAGLQSRMLSMNQSSLFRSQAMALTDDILDRMRVDRQHAVSGDWNTDFETASSAVTGDDEPSQFDLRDWKKQVEDLLPGGCASIQMDAARNNAVTITIDWRDSRQSDSFTCGSSDWKLETISSL